MTVIIKQQFISSHLIWQKLTQLQDKFLFLCVTNQERYWHFTENTIKNDENDACFCSFWTIWQLMWAFYPLANEVAKGYSNATVRPSVRPSHPCERSRINILQWILIKLGTYLVLRRIWNPIDFPGQRSRSPGQIFTA